MQPRSQVILLLLFCLSMVGILLVWNVAIRIDDFNMRQMVLAERSVNAAANEVELLIQGYQRSLQIFSDENQMFMDNVALWPQDIDLYSILKEKIDKYFPDHFAFTLADKAGGTLLEGFEGLVGEDCRADINKFATNNDNYLIHIHKGPESKFQHFDIMASWQGEATNEDILFVSFRPDHLVRILKNTQVVGHQLLLVRRDEPGLVDVSTLDEQGVLGAEAISRISYSLPVSGTLWNVVILRDENHFDESYRSIVLQAMGIFLGFLFINIIMFMILSDQQKDTKRGPG